MTNQPNNYTPYSPTPHDGFLVWWSYFWRFSVISIIVAFPIMAALLYFAGPDIKEGMDAAQIQAVQEEFVKWVLQEESLFKILLFILDLFVGYVAIRDMRKVKYETFTFVKELITPRDIFIIALAINGFSFIFGLFAGPTLSPEGSPGSVFFFILIRNFVTWALLYQFMSGGLLGARLPLMARDDRC